jgi:hypothetical protein
VDPDAFMRDTDAQGGTALQASDVGTGENENGTTGEVSDVINTAWGTSLACITHESYEAVGGGCLAAADG